MSTPVLQVALDLLELPRALAIAAEAVAGGADWIEAGTPLIKSEGMTAVRALAERFPGHEIVADMKVADTGTLEVEMAAKAGATIVCVLADADDTVIEEALRAGRLYGVRIMADLINVADPLPRARRLAELGVDILNAHVGIDQQMIGRTSVELIERLAGEVTVPLAVAGGLDERTAADAVASGASVVIVGGTIVRSGDVEASTRRVKAALAAPKRIQKTSVPLEEEIRRLLETVSAPHVTDAMHRHGAMIGMVPLSPGLRIVGPAVTVQTFAGDWAKPVEAIDRARPGDVLVINNDGGTHVAPWGELATLSARNRGIAGVVIDGAVRDVDDIRRMEFPLFARGTCPNAGEPKGFGEINAEIRCAGQVVRPGDWIVGDESGVVVVPREKAYEVARRAVEVRKTEERIREELRRGGTLASVSELLKWEKRRT
ncbi:MAG TPA: orotidine 5'-phosphate decarboxylase [Methanoregulaceae archaeon]|nr:orotidine 5'-phosphate decarboxylase [Methanoregulaceae archaeon]HQJ87493.1 orotidine 5'-phosphate decarboxylase [Methanoregulaceae archaeon]